MNGLLAPALARLRRTAFRIAPEETTFKKRGFRPGRAEAQARLETIGGTFVTGYHAALESQNIGELAVLLDSIDLDFRGFAFEGAAMALTLLDHLAPWRQSRFAEFLAGPGGRHAYMLHIGTGWAYARLPWLRFRPDHAARNFDPLMRWLTLDGFGFHEPGLAPAKVK